MNEELMDGKDRLLEEIRRLKELLKGVREERDYLFNKLSTEKLWLQQENENLRTTIKNDDVAVNNLCKEIENLKQQLKDKDEKISNLIKLLIEMVFDDIDYLGVYQELVARHLVKLGYIVKEDGYYKELESNKED